MSESEQYIELPPHSLVGDTFKSSLRLTQISFEYVSDKNTYCDFLFRVSTPYQSHIIRKRYSEFRKFRSKLKTTIRDKKHCKTGPCLQFQKEHGQLTSFPKRRLDILTRLNKVEVACTRVMGLDRFLQSLLWLYQDTTRLISESCASENCCFLQVIEEFLGLSGDTTETMSINESIGMKQKMKITRDRSLAFLEAQSTAEESWYSLEMSYSDSDVSSDASDEIYQIGMEENITGKTKRPISMDRERYDAILSLWPRLTKNNCFYGRASEPSAPPVDW